MPTVIAIDGQPVTPHVSDAPIVIGAAGRVDLILGVMEKPGSASPVIDRFYREPFDWIIRQHFLTPSICMGTL